jgi:hypothetical protein
LPKTNGVGQSGERKQCLEYLDLTSWHAAEKAELQRDNFPGQMPSFRSSLEIQRSPMATPECRADDSIGAVEANADGIQINSADDIS